MKIRDIRILRGPNYWSNYWKKLIVLKLDIEDYELKPTDVIPDFKERLLEALPRIDEHMCSHEQKGGFIKRIERGTWAGHVIEHLALQLQIEAEINVGYGRTRGTSSDGVYNVAVEYEEEEAGLLAVNFAVELFQMLAEFKDLNYLKQRTSESIEKIRRSYNRTKLGPSTSSIVEEAIRRGIPYIRLDNGSYVQLGYGKNSKRIMATMTESTGYISTENASDKQYAKELLYDMGIPTPKGKVISDFTEIENVFKELDFPLVVKPLDGNHGKGVKTNIRDMKSLLLAFREAKNISDKVIIEKFVEGKDFRALVVNGKFIACAERIPAHVIGDGKSKISELIELVNSAPERGDDHENFLSKIVVDPVTLQILADNELSLDTTLPEGYKLTLKDSANLSTGGEAIDRTNEVHPDNVFMFERIASIIGLDIAGIDIVAPDISNPIDEDGAIIEINAAPGFRMHLHPTYGEKRNVAKSVVDMLFPEGKPSRIPIFSITGTNGKTTTTRLLAHITKAAGYFTGMTTTDGTYLNDRRIMKGDHSGPQSAKMILKDKFVEAAVLETARGGILREGLGFDNCDIGIVLNITSDHLGLGDIETMEELAKVKSVVAYSVHKTGFAVLNADDSRIMEFKDDLDCRIALFSKNPHNPIVRTHIMSGGKACLAEEGKIIIYDNGSQNEVENLHNIPLTLNGIAAFSSENIMAASLAAYCYGIDIRIIKEAVKTFKPCPETTPGRLNFVDMDGFTALVDYAHNEEAFNALKSMIEKLPFKKVTGVFGGTGDRRDEDIIKLGELAANMFSRFIINEGDFCRGRKDGMMSLLIQEGINKVLPGVKAKIIHEEKESINYALNTAENGELLVILSGRPELALETLKNKKEFKTIRNLILPSHRIKLNGLLKKEVN